MVTKVAKYKLVFLKELKKHTHKENKKTSMHEITFC